MITTKEKLDYYYKMLFQNENNEKIANHFIKKIEMLESEMSKKG